MKTIALDSYPKLGEINFDYSSSQIYSLCALPLLEPEYFPLPEYKSLHHGEISYKDATKIQVELSCPQFFHNKQPVIAEHYLNRFIFLKKISPSAEIFPIKLCKNKNKKEQLIINCTMSH